MNWQSSYKQLRITVSCSQLNIAQQFPTYMQGPQGHQMGKLQPVLFTVAQQNL